MRNEARHLFFQRKTLTEVANALAISKSTAERWSRQGGWVEQRALLELELKDKYLRENFNTHYFKLKDAAADSFRLMAAATAERQLVFEGKLSARRLKFSNRTLLAAAKTFVLLQGAITDLEPYKRTPKSG